MNEPRKQITYRKLLFFFLPLAITPTMIGMSHSIIDAALARLPSPALSIAIFSIVKGLSNVIKSPIYMSRQVVASLVDSRESYIHTMKFLGAFCAFFLLVLMGLGYTPLGGWVFRNIIGLTEPEQIAYAYFALRITCFLPVVEYLRNSHQGIVISLQKTKLILPGIILRLVVISSFLWWTVRTQAVLGITAGSLTWLFGIGIEGVFIIVSLFVLYGSPARAADLMPSINEKPLTNRDLLKFFLPLGLMMSLAAFVQPLIQSGIARTESPTQALAAFGVSMGLMFVMSGSLSLLHNVSLVYAGSRSDANWPYIFKFCIFIGVIISTAIFTLALSPLGYWVFNKVIAVSPEITEIAQRIMLILAVVPLARAIREAYWGLLMTERNTRVIGLAKISNIIALFLTLSLALLRLDLNPALIGAVAYTTGEIVETGMVIYQAVSD